jgi:hypothetical protein
LPLRRDLAERSWGADRYAVVSTDRKLTDLDRNEHEDVYVRDLLLGTIDGITLRGDSPSGQASVSDDGRFVVFASAATNLTGGHAGQHVDVFLWNRLSNKLVCVTEGADADSSDPTLSGDGEVIAFSSKAQLLPADTNQQADIYLYARQGGELTLLQGTHAGDAVSPTLNSDGSLAAYVAKQFGYWQIFGWSREEGSTALLSRNASNVAGNGDSFFPSLSDAGLLYSTRADNLVPSDTNSEEDVMALTGSLLTRVVEDGSRPVVARQSLDGVFVREGQIQLVRPQGSPVLLALGAGQEASLSRDRVLLANGSDRKVCLPDKEITRTLNPAFQPSAPFVGFPFQNIGIARYGRVLHVDINSDGRKDVVSQADDEGGPRGFMLAIANADGTFEAEYFSVGGTINGYDQGDLNGDNRADLVVSVNTGTYAQPVNLLKVYFGDGMGSLTLGTTRAITRSDAVPFVGQLSGDSHLDVLLFTRVYTGAGPAPQILVGNGSGSLADGPVLPMTNHPGPPVVADFDNDGFADVAVLDDATGQVAVMINDGSGGAEGTIQRLTVTAPGGLNYNTAQAVDLDLDGDLDLLVDIREPAGANQAQVLTNTSGVFTVGSVLPITWWGAYEELSVTSGDFDGDGSDEILIGSYLLRPESQEVTLWKSSIQDPIGVADINGDQHLDVLLHHETGVTYVFGNGDATFGPSSVVEPPLVSLYFSVTGDFNNDLLVDIVDARTVLLGTQEKTFVAQTLDLPIGETLSREDFNNDGHLDLLAVGRGEFTVCLGDGAGGLQALPSQPVERLWGVAPEVQDVDQDGHIDLFLIRNGVSLDNSFEFWKGAGDGTFALTSSVVQRSSTSLIHLADVNNDGAVDVWASDYILFASQPGVFGTPQDRYASENFRDALFGDLDGDRSIDGFSLGSPYSAAWDGYPDEPAPIIYANSKIFRYSGQTETISSTLLGPERRGEQNYIRGIVTEDADQDGDLDIHILDSLGNLCWAINNGDGTYTQQAPLHYSTSFYQMTRLDYDFDGRFDKLLTGFGASFLP